MSSLSARVAALEARATDAGARDAANVDAALAAASRAGERVETVERGLDGVSRGLEGVSRGFDALERRLESLEASSSAAAKVSSADGCELRPAVDLRTAQATGMILRLSFKRLCPRGGRGGQRGKIFQSDIRLSGFICGTAVTCAKL